MKQGLMIYFLSIKIIKHKEEIGNSQYIYKKSNKTAYYFYIL